MPGITEDVLRLVVASLKNIIRYLVPRFAIRIVEDISESFFQLRKNFVFARVPVEDKGVIGDGVFFRCRPEKYVWLLACANFVLVFLKIISGPVYLLLFPFIADRHLLHIGREWWRTEFPNIHRAVLATATSGSGRGMYERSNLPPRWVLEVSYDKRSWRQVIWTDTIRFTALSYAYKSAQHLASRPGIGEPTPDQPIFLQPRTYTHDPNVPGDQADLIKTQERHGELIERQKVARMFLLTYMESRLGEHATGVEHIWLDEFCLTDASIQDVRKLVDQREEEVGRLADIFRAAQKVCVFCHIDDCNHAGLQCPWVTRLFTLAEILNANSVVRMTQGPHGYSLHEEEGRLFRERMQAQASLDGRWHLYSIMQHASNSGTPRGKTLSTLFW
jgi:hypothetical protein